MNDNVQQNGGQVAQNAGDNQVQLIEIKLNK